MKENVEPLYARVSWMRHWLWAQNWSKKPLKQ